MLSFYMLFYFQLRVLQKAKQRNLQTEVHLVKLIFAQMVKKFPAFY